MNKLETTSEVLKFYMEFYSSISQSELARRLSTDIQEISRQTMSNWVSGETEPNVAALRAFEFYYHTDLAEMQDLIDELWRVSIYKRKPQAQDGK